MIDGIHDSVCNGGGLTVNGKVNIVRDMEMDCSGDDEIFEDFINDVPPKDDTVFANDDNDSRDI